VHDDEEGAYLEAGDHLSAAFGGRPSPEVLAQRLRESGYVSVTDFRIVAENSGKDIGFVPAIDPDE
jgi:hypothetical protein